MDNNKYSQIETKKNCYVVKYGNIKILIRFVDKYYLDYKLDASSYTVFLVPIGRKSVEMDPNLMIINCYTDLRRSPLFIPNILCKIDLSNILVEYLNDHPLNLNGSKMRFEIESLGEGNQCGHRNYCTNHDYNQLYNILSVNFRFILETNWIINTPDVYPTGELTEYKMGNFVRKRIVNNNYYDGRITSYYSIKLVSTKTTRIVSELEYKTGSIKEEIVDFNKWVTSLINSIFEYTNKFGPFPISQDKGRNQNLQNDDLSYLFDLSSWENSCKVIGQCERRIPLNAVIIRTKVVDGEFKVYFDFSLGLELNGISMITPKFFEKYFRKCLTYPTTIKISDLIYLSMGRFINNCTERYGLQKMFDENDEEFKEILSNLPEDMHDTIKRYYKIIRSKKEVLFSRSGFHDPKRYDEIFY